VERLVERALTYAVEEYDDDLALHQCRAVNQLAVVAPMPWPS
jgi:hypothetical protein